MDTVDLEKYAAGSERYVAGGPPEMNFEHHLSLVAKDRKVSPLKSMFRFLTIPGIIMMAGGLPDADYFPYDSLSAEALTPDALSSPSLSSPSSSNSSTTGPFAWLWKLFGTNGSVVPTKTLTIPKYTSDPTDIQLSTALQYGMATGQPKLHEFIEYFVKKVYQPLNSKTVTLVNVGNTDGWAKIVLTLCNPGDLILTEEWTYPSAMAAAEPYGIKPVGIAMDGEGMRADSLEEILENWDVEARGAARPHVLYTVPIGQNPSGTTMGAERKKAIYNVCVKYDVIIVEDDPYFFLQVGEYVPKSRRATASGDSEQEFIDSLAPSYLKFDYQGRVIRLDTFSKVIAPGSRLGWFTCNPLFAERLERLGETSTQAPSGFTQALITQLLVHQWGYSGYIRWLRGIRSQYTLRRDAMLDGIAAAFDIEESQASQGEFAPLTGDVRVFVARAKKSKSGSAFWRADAEKEKKGKILFTFVPPTAGMFVWLKVHLYNHPAYSPDTPAPKTPEESLEFKVWEDLALNKVLFGPGWVFGSDADSTLTAPLVDVSPNGGAKAMSDGGKYGHFRISFSNPSAEMIAEAMKRFAFVMDKQFA